MDEKKKLGEILLEAGVIDKFQLKSALAEQNKWGGRLGNHLVQMGILTEELLVKALSKQLKIPNLDLSAMVITRDVLELVPQELAEKFHLVPVAVKKIASKKTLIVAMSDPTNLDAVDELQFRTGHIIKPAVAGDTAIEVAIRRYYYGEEPVAPAGGKPAEAIPFGSAAHSAATVAEEPTLPPEQTFAPALTPEPLQPLNEASLSELGAQEMAPAEGAQDYQNDPTAATAPEAVVPTDAAAAPDWQGGTEATEPASWEAPDAMAAPAEAAPELLAAAPGVDEAWADPPADAAPVEAAPEEAAPEATDAPAWGAEDRTDPDGEASQAADGAAPAAWGDPGAGEALAEAVPEPIPEPLPEEAPMPLDAPLSAEGEAPQWEEPAAGPAEAAVAAIESAPADWSAGEAVHTMLGDSAPMEPTAPGEPTFAGETSEPPQEIGPGPEHLGPSDAPVDEVPAEQAWAEAPPGDEPVSEANGSIGPGVPGENGSADAGVVPEELAAAASLTEQEDPLAWVPHETLEGRAVRALLALLLEKGLITPEEILARLKAAEAG